MLYLHTFIIRVLYMHTITPPRIMILSLSPASSLGVLHRSGRHFVYPLRERTRAKILYYLHGPLYRTPRRRIRNSPGDRPWCQQPVNARYINVGMNTRQCLCIRKCACACVQCWYIRNRRLRVQKPHKNERRHILPNVASNPMARRWRRRRRCDHRRLYTIFLISVPTLRCAGVYNMWVCVRTYTCMCVCVCVPTSTKTSLLLFFFRLFFFIFNLFYFTFLVFFCLFIFYIYIYI